MPAGRGEVWQIDFGLAAKVRPALLLTGEPASDELDLFKVLLHTTALRNTPFYLQQVQSTSGANLLRRLGALSADEIAKVEKTIVARLGCQGHLLAASVYVQMSPEGGDRRDDTGQS